MREVSTVRLPSPKNGSQTLSIAPIWKRVR
jgi:hypothetical protein